MILEFGMACPECSEVDIEIKILDATKGWPGDFMNPPEPDEVEWEVSKGCTECGLDKDSDVSQAAFDLIENQCFEKLYDLEAEYFDE
jgi:hypothetical protein